MNDGLDASDKSQSLSYKYYTLIKLLFSGAFSRSYFEQSMKLAQNGVFPM